MYFGSNPGTEHQLYNIFWKCVDMLEERSVYVVYILTSGAPTNRKFAGMLLPHSESVFSDILFPQNKVVYIQDVMHCIKTPVTT